MEDRGSHREGGHGEGESYAPARASPREIGGYAREIGGYAREIGGYAREIGG